MPSRRVSVCLASATSSTTGGRGGLAGVEAWDETDANASSISLSVLLPLIVLLPPLLIVLLLPPPPVVGSGLNRAFAISSSSSRVVWTLGGIFFVASVSLPLILPPPP